MDHLQKKTQVNLDRFSASLGARGLGNWLGEVLQLSKAKDETNNHRQDAKKAKNKLLSEQNLLIPNMILRLSDFGIKTALS